MYQMQTLFFPSKCRYKWIGPIFSTEGYLGTFSSFQVTHVYLEELMMWGNITLNKSDRSNYQMLLLYTELCLSMCLSDLHFFTSLLTYLKLEQGWIIQWPAAFCLTLSCIRAFLDPKSFIASLLSVGWNMLCRWFLTQPGLESAAAWSSSSSSSGGSSPCKYKNLVI